VKRLEFLGILLGLGTGQGLPLKIRKLEPQECSVFTTSVNFGTITPVFFRTGDKEWARLPHLKG